jgi:hypothetical protein
LPDHDFWANFSYLQFLFIHDNPLSRLSFIKSLSVCPRLEILTLYDTPLSLKKNYRHFTVNTIVTLKALDHFIVSDDEIIEGASYNNQFSARTKGFYINLDNYISKNVNIISFYYP